jgi:hypothetical protein
MASSGMLRRVALIIHFAFLHTVRRLIVTADVHSSPILVTLMIEALLSSETSALTRATRRNISADSILHSHRRENITSYKFSVLIRASLRQKPDRGSVSRIRDI